MGQLFAKLFQSIFDSSIADDWQARIVFQDMLILADEDGTIDMTPESIARRTNIPFEIISAAIPKLESPDPSSRTPDHEGRRILRLSSQRAWGWRVVNFAKYRESASKEMLKMAEADRKRAFRAKYRGNPSPTPPTQYGDPDNKRERQTRPGHVRDVSRTAADSRFAEQPSLKEVKIEAQRIGLADWVADDWFLEMEAAGWKFKGQPIAKWQAFLARKRTWWEADGRPMSPPSRNGKPNKVPEKNQLQEKIPLKLL